MLIKNMTFFALIICCANTTQAMDSVNKGARAVNVLLSAALVAEINPNFEFRKQQSIDTLNIVKGYGYENPYVVEALRKKGPTFLETYCSQDHICYAQLNDPSLKNPGLNEPVTLWEAAHQFNFPAESLVLKLTGRYQPTSPYLFELAEKNEGNYDAYVKVCKKNEIKQKGFARPEEVLTLAYVMRAKFFLDMNRSVREQIKSLDDQGLTGESAVTSYIKAMEQEGSMKVHYLDKLDVRANLRGSSTAPGAQEEIVDF